MYLRTDFNKRAEILLKLSKEQVTGKEFELIDIILVVAPDVRPSGGVGLTSDA
jgi:hypothetical protein